MRGSRVILNRSNGAVVQLVRIPACHAGGRGFEPRPLRQNTKRLRKQAFFFGALRCRVSSGGQLHLLTAKCCQQIVQHLRQLARHQLKV